MAWGYLTDGLNRLMAGQGCSTLACLSSSTNVGASSPHTPGQRTSPLETWGEGDKSLSAEFEGCPLIIDRRSISLEQPWMVAGRADASEWSPANGLMGRGAVAFWRRLGDVIARIQIELRFQVSIILVPLGAAVEYGTFVHRQ